MNYYSSKAFAYLTKTLSVMQGDAFNQAVKTFNIS